MDTRAIIKRLCDLAHRHIDPDAVARARQRQAAVFAWSELDYLPLVTSVTVPELGELPAFDWREQWHDPAKSFIEQMKGAISAGAAHADAIPAVRADHGVITVPSLFGTQFAVPAHTKPVATSFPAKAQLASFSLPDDISRAGVMPRLIEHTEHHLAVLRAHGLQGLVDVHHCDTQGPFDIACQALGHQIFTEMYDDPAFVHHLMAQATKAYIAVSRLCKKLQGEGESCGNASGYWMTRGGVRLCDDSSILISANLFAEFVLPCHIQALAAFGGGWIHYCGGVPGGGRAEGLHLHELYASIPGLRGLNFTTGRDWHAEVRKLVARRVAYVGWFPHPGQESLEEHFTRILQLLPGRAGCILHTTFREEEQAQALDAWHRAQDRRAGASQD